jgi:hypothetical protein
LARVLGRDRRDEPSVLVGWLDGGCVGGPELCDSEPDLVFHERKEVEQPRAAGRLSEGPVDSRSASTTSPQFASFPNASSRTEAAVVGLHPLLGEPPVIVVPAQIVQSTRATEGGICRPALRDRELDSAGDSDRSACEHAFVTAQGSPLTRLRRALAGGVLSQVDARDRLEHRGKFKAHLVGVERRRRSGASGKSPWCPRCENFVRRDAGFSGRFPLTSRERNAAVDWPRRGR